MLWTYLSKIPYGHLMAGTGGEERLGCRNGIELNMASARGPVAVQQCVSVSTRITTSRACVECRQR